MGRAAWKKRAGAWEGWEEAVGPQGGVGPSCHSAFSGLQVRSRGGLSVMRTQVRSLGVSVFSGEEPWGSQCSQDPGEEPWGSQLYGRAVEEPLRFHLMYLGNAVL